MSWLRLTGMMRLALAISIGVALSTTALLAVLVTVVPLTYRAHPLETAVGFFALILVGAEAFAVVVRREL